MSSKLPSKVRANEDQGVPVGHQLLGGDPGAAAGGADCQAGQAGGEDQRHQHL